MSHWIVRDLGWHFGWHGNNMAPDHPKMILGVHRDRMQENKCPWMDSQSETRNLPIQS